MADTVTPHYGWVKPQVGGDATTWGATLNNDLDEIDAQVFANASNYAATVVVAPNEINLNTTPGPAGNLIQGQAAGVPRWQIQLGNGAAETGGNAGSDFGIYGFSDSGAYLNNPLAITRASGGVSVGPGGLGVSGALTAFGTATFGSNVAFNGAITFPNFYGAHSFELGWSTWGVHVLVDGTDEAVLTAGYTTPGDAGVTGTFGVGSTLNVGGVAYAASFSVNGTNTYLGNEVLQFASGCYIQGSGQITFVGGGAELAEMDTGGAFGITGQAYKPGGGSWLNSSDARIKTVERGYELGLDQILRLEPVVYRFKGNDAAPGKASKMERVRDKSFVGLVAQDVESIFPGMVTQRKGYVDGQEVDNFRDLDTSELIFALVNAVKTLAAEVQELKAR